MAEQAITTLYTLLVDRACAGLTRPMALNEAELAALKEQIDAAARRPIEGPRLIGSEAVALITALLCIVEARAARDADQEQTFTQIVGVLLAPVRKRWAAAIAAHRRNTVVTTDQDYITKKR